MNKTAAARPGGVSWWPWVPSMRWTSNWRNASSQTYPARRSVAVKGNGRRRCQRQKKPVTAGAEPVT